MADNVNITVQDTINDIVVNTAVTVETIDINMQAAVDVVDIVANPNNYIVNINRIIGEQVQSDWDQSDNQAPDYIKNKPTIPAAQVNSDWNATSGVAEILNKPIIPAAVTKTSDLTNDGADGVHPFITIEDVPVPTNGLPSGGTAGQILTKVDSTDYNATWQENFADWTSVVKHTVKNNGVTTLSKGKAVYVTSSNGTNMLVGYASNDTEATSSKTMGLLQSTLATTGSTSTGFVITEGLLEGLDTQGTTAGDPVWLGVGGNLIYGLANKPYAPAHLVFIGIVTKVSAGNGEIFVKVQNGFELREIHDVDLITTTPINGHILGFDGTLWVNKTIASWLGFTPVTNARTISTTAPLSGGGDLSANRTLSISQANTSTNGYLSSTDWNTFNNKQSADLFTRMSKGWEAYTDYISAAFNDGWTSRVSNTGSITSSSFLSGINKNGICLASTGTNALSFAGPEFGSPNTNLGFGIGTGELIFEQLIMIPTLSTSAERFVVFQGLIGAAVFTNPSNAIFFYYDEGGTITSASPNWKCYTSNAGVRTLTNSGIVVNSGQWYKLRVVVNAAATSVAFYIDGTLVATHTTNIPPTTIGYGFDSIINKTVGTTARVLYTDYSAISQTFTTPR